MSNKSKGILYTICGSLDDHEDNRQEMYRYEALLASIGVPTCLPINKPLETTNFGMLSFIHKAKIDESNGIVVIIPDDDSIGKGIMSEIEYARELGIDIFYNKIPDVWNSDEYTYHKIDSLNFDLYKEMKKE